jgi:nucleoside-diphosphate-sugar epimerase
LARVLIVGCGCRGRDLAQALMEDGHAVRGSSRDPGRRAQLEALGAEAVDADPDRLGTLLPYLAGVTVLVWLLGEADAPALHDERLEAILGEIVDTPVRGFVYEQGTEEGAEIARRAAATHHMPVEVVPAGESAAKAVARVLAA